VLGIANSFHTFFFFRLNFKKRFRSKRDKTKRDSKRDLESTIRSCKAQTRPLGRAAILFYLSSDFFGYCNYIFFFLLNLAERMSVLNY